MEKTKDELSAQLNDLLRVNVNWSRMSKEDLEQVYEAVSSLNLLRILQLRKERVMERVSGQIMNRPIAKRLIKRLLE